MIFLTFNDAPNGIYYSQVADVCNFLNKEFNANIKLVALISVRSFWKNRRKIKSKLQNAIVIPMFPTIRLWNWNFLTIFFLFIFINPKKIIARGPFAAGLCLMMKKIGLTHKVIFDARGASAAEVREYDVIRNPTIKRNIFFLESRAVNESDFRISVSTKLVEHWIKEFGYNKDEHVIIPCTLSEMFLKELPSEEELSTLKKKYSFSENNIVLAFSGSSAQWHSYSVLDEFICNMLKNNVNVSVLLLADDSVILKCMNNYPDRVRRIWLPYEKVREVLLIADYGILIRERSITNKVSSPVKFAEYLACGLRILISEEVGDFSQFVVDNHCGSVIKEFKREPILSKISFYEKENLNKLALKQFSKKNFQLEYKALLNF